MSGTARIAIPLLLFDAVTAAAEPPSDWRAVGSVFKERCVMCHSEDGAALGLRLDSYEGALSGSENGPVLVPGDAVGSELLRRLQGDSLPRMPFLSTRLPPDQISLVERWIKAGLPELCGTAECTAAELPSGARLPRKPILPAPQSK